MPMYISFFYPSTEMLGDLAITNRQNFIFGNLSIWVFAQTFER